MTISAKVLNDSIKELSDSNSLLDMLLESDSSFILSDSNNISKRLLESDSSFIYVIGV